MGMKKWLTAELDKALAKELAEECGVDPIVALIASSRGYTDPDKLEEFLADEPCFSRPVSVSRYRQGCGYSEQSRGKRRENRRFR